MHTVRFELDDILQFRNASVYRLIVGVLLGGGYLTRSPLTHARYSTAEDIDPMLEDGWHKVGSVAGLDGEELNSALNRYGFPSMHWDVAEVAPTEEGRRPFIDVMGDWFNEERGRLSAESAEQRKRENFETRAAAGEERKPMVEDSSRVTDRYKVQMLANVSPSIEPFLEDFALVRPSGEPLTGAGYYSVKEHVERMMDLADSVIVDRRMRRSFGPHEVAEIEDFLKLRKKSDG